MEYQNPDIARVAAELKKKMADLPDKQAILRDFALKSLYEQLRTLQPDQRPVFGKELNKLKEELEELVEEQTAVAKELSPIDVTAPWDLNVPADKRPRLLSTDLGSQHPVMSELAVMLDILNRMGFEAVEARELDDDYHMFASLNFPEGHPARDDFDTFMTTDGLIAPAHTSTMQNRVLKAQKERLEKGQAIAAVVPGRVFRNEDLDARHEHTFYQLEGIYVSKNVTVGHLMATLKTFMQAYYGKELKLKTQPFYFPFTEPSFEFAISCPFCNGVGCNICGEGWIELLGCGMIHPNVLKMADIDPTVYTGFAWGIGFMRMIMIKYGIEDIRHFTSGKIEFLRQFS